MEWQIREESKLKVLNDWERGKRVKRSCSKCLFAVRSRVKVRG